MWQRFCRGFFFRHLNWSSPLMVCVFKFLSPLPKYYYQCCQYEIVNQKLLSKGFINLFAFWFYFRHICCNGRIFICLLTCQSKVISINKSGTLNGQLYFSNSVNHATMGHFCPFMECSFSQTHHNWTFQVHQNCDHQIKHTILRHFEAEFIISS